MSQPTALNTNFKGLVEDMAIPAEVHERDGKKFASYGSAVPIHCCTPEQVADLSNSTHHYCDIFTQELLAPLGELAYVRLNESLAEKVFINRTKRLLLRSADGRLAQWRAAPTFESHNQLLAGTPVVDHQGNLVSLVTAKRGNHYAVSTFEGEGGYFDTPLDWLESDPGDSDFVYGTETFESLAELRRHVASLEAADGAGGPARAVALLARGRRPRLALVAQNGRQLAHYYLQAVTGTDVQYL